MTTNTLHEKILNEFLNSNIKIKSLDKLNDYISYCIDNNQNQRILNEDGYSKTSLHHILPKAKDCFPEFKDLKSNKWNGTYLLYSDHYYAHWLLTEAIDSYSQLSAFCAMHNMDMKSERINKLTHIPAKEFQEKMEERSSKHSEWCKNNPEKIKERTRKIKLTCEKVQKNGKTIYQEQGESVSQWYKDNPEKVLKKVAKFMLWRVRNPEKVKKQINNRLIAMTTVLENGLTKYNQASIKQLKTRNSKEWKETVGKEAKRKELETKSSKEWKETVGKKAIEKQLKTKSSKEWKESVWKPALEKRSELVKSKEWKETVGKEAIEKQLKTKRRNAKKYKVINAKGNIIYNNLIMKDICNIYQGLKRATKAKPLGSYKCKERTLLALKNKKLLHLLGAYIEVI